jgi:plastocyanin
MTGKMVASGGGRQGLSVMRFFPQTLFIQQGDTVQFTNVDPTEPHTVTSGTSDTLTNDMALVNASPVSDGALTSTVNTAADFGSATPTTGVNSGFLQASAEDAAGRAQSVPGTTRIRIQFNTPGTFYYHCALHDVDGMNGSVVVNPSAAGPTATLTANGAHSLTVKAGSTINYAWSSSGAVAAVSFYTVDGGPPAAWVANSLSSSVSGTVASGQVGHTYVITYSVINSVGQRASDQVTIAVTQ